MSNFTKEQSDKIKWNIERNWLGVAPGTLKTLPANFRVLHLCECGHKYGFVWGVENEEGQTRYLKNESGNLVKKCGKCMVEEQEAIEKTIIKHNIQKLRESEERNKDARTKTVKYRDVNYHGNKESAAKAWTGVEKKLIKNNLLEDK